jgi:hypothetical protein
MMADARAGRLDVVAVWRFDRFARDTRHLLTAMDDFRTLGVHFVSLREQVDTSTPMGKAMFTIVSAIRDSRPCPSCHDHLGRRADDLMRRPQFSSTPCSAGGRPPFSSRRSGRVTPDRVTARRPASPPRRATYPVVCLLFSQEARRLPRGSDPAVVNSDAK